MNFYKLMGLLSFKTVFYVFAFFLSVNIMFGQSTFIEGFVFDKESKEPLSFVNIVADSGNRGGVSDINGRFRLKFNEMPNTLTFSYVGYGNYIYELAEINDLKIYLSKNEILLDEVIIVPGENPAHRIIDSVVANRHLNNPLKRSSFEYKSHNKLSFTIDAEDFIKNNIIDSSSYNETLNIIDKSYLMLIESITHRKFLYPDNDNEVVLASKVSGIKDPIFSLIASQLQAFSFYDEHINIFDKRFLNPISKGTTNRYLFILEDTAYHNNDTVFIMSFRPRINRNFDGLKGLLYINTNGYAIQNVTAAPADGSISNFDVQIKQSYELINDKYWFPVQLNTELSYTYPDAINLKIIGDGRSYINNIEIDGKIHKRDFSNFAFEISKGAADKDEDFWNNYRYEPLTEKDLETYRVIDSLSKVHNFNRISNLFRALAEAKVPYKIFNIDIDKIVSFNNYNGWRLGLGLETNNKVSSLFNVGGYFAYATRNNNFRYGANTKLNINKRNDAAFSYVFVNDDLESAPLNKFDFVPKLQLNDFRSYSVSITDNTFLHAASFSVRPTKYLLSKVTYSYSEMQPNFDYMFTQSYQNISYLRNNFTFSEFSLNFRFAYKEAFIFSDDYKISLGTKYPIVNFGFNKGFDEFLNGEFSYSRYDVEVDHSFYIKLLGLSRIVLQGGYISEDLPYSKLYNGRGSNDAFTIYSPFTFSTMQLNEFLSDKYAAVMYQHNFGSLLFKKKWFKPELILATNYCIGSLRSPESHRNINFSTLEKGYIESGIIVNNILTTSFYGLGVATFYRYGNYKLKETKNNFAVQLSLKISL